LRRGANSCRHSNLEFLLMIPRLRVAAKTKTVPLIAAFEEIRL